MDKIKGTVTLDLKEYNELRDFKENIEAGYTFITHRGSMMNYKTHFVGTDKALKTIHQDIELKQKEIDKIIESLSQIIGPWRKKVDSESMVEEVRLEFESKQREIDRLKKLLKQDPSIDDIKAMSWWEFRKWKRR